MPRKKSDSMEEILVREEERMWKQGEGRVFYHPGRGANCIYLGGGEISEVGIPAGYELDLEVWEQRGADGEAPLKPLKVEAAPAPASG